MSDSDTAASGLGAVVARLPEDYGMISLRGEFQKEEVADSLSNCIGTEIPGNGRFVRAGNAKTAWMAQDELLLIVPLSELEATLDAVGNLRLSDPFSAVDVSDMRVVFEVSGSGSRDVVAKGAPMDLSSEVFGPGSFRRTRLGQVAVMVWMEEEPAVRLACRRSEADYAEEFLKVAASRDIPGFYRVD